MAGQPVSAAAENQDPRPACQGQTDVFFPDSYNDLTVAKARALCRRCPLFESCVSWGLENYPQIEHGIFFGHTPAERLAFWCHLATFEDWRSQVIRPTGRRLAALEKQALRQGVKAVVDLYRFYEIEDEQERVAVLAAYEEWKTSKLFPASFAPAASRAARLAAGAKDRAGRAARVPVDMRPSCPNGHEKRDMARQRGGDVWICYVCRAQVSVPVKEILGLEKGA